MTWREFKELVDSKLSEMNLDENVVVSSIDTYSFPDADDLTVELDASDNLCVSG